MFLENLKQIYAVNKHKRPLLLRNLVKETIQIYILNYIFNSPWGSRLIMKGGTCLRFCFGLPRLSEDLDFDIEDNKAFKIEAFSRDLKDYFAKTLQFPKVEFKLAGNKRTIYLKFPILADLGFPLTKSESNIIHVRLDFAIAPKFGYTTEISLKSTPDFSFLIRRYSLPDLFAGKILAIISRETIEGTVKKERFKGRDYYDLAWFLEKEVMPNWIFIEQATGLKKKDVVVKIKEKINAVTPKFIKEDLLPFFENTTFIDDFSRNFHSLISSRLERKILS